MGGNALRARRVRRVRQQLVDELAANEPRTTLVLADLVTHGLAPWRARAWEVRDRGRLLGVLVATRRAFDDWHAVAYLADPAAAPALGAALDHSPARSVAGSVADVVPLRRCADRSHTVFGLPIVFAPPPIAVVGPPDPSTRTATRADLDALAELYEGFEWFPVATRWQVRQLVRRTLRTGLVVVAEHGGRIVGAAMVSARTAHWGVLDALTVLPEHRRSGVAWAIAARAQAIGNDLGIGAVFALVPSNPMPFDHLLADDAWASVFLEPRHRFPGQGRLRDLYGRVGRRHERVAETFREQPVVDRSSTAETPT